MSKLFETRFAFAPDIGAGGGDGGTTPPATPPTTPTTYEEWYGAQDESTKTLLEGHIKGLKSALGSEREARDKAEKDLRQVAKKLDEGSEAQKEVLKLADAVAEGNTKADFYENAHEAGVSNLKLAYLVASNDGLFDKRGNVDFANMKENYPELFTKSSPKPSGSAGQGTGGELPPTATMNSYIRKSAGRIT